MNNEIYNNEFVIEKLEKELKEMKSTKLGQKELAIADHVAEKLILFSENEIFGLAIQNKEEKLSDCCKEIMKGVKNYISDIEVYKRAAQFYFPRSSIDFTMTVNIGDVLNASKNNKKINISLDDLF